MTAKGLKKAAAGDKEEEEEDIDQDWEAVIEEEEKNAFSLARVREMAAPEAFYMTVGSIGALMAGSVFPLWGLLFAETIDLLFRIVEPCEEATAGDLGFDTCQDYRDDMADDMRDRSFIVAGYWAIIAVGAVLGNVIVFWGFGNASERINKRTRDDAFTALVRQEVAFFDKRSVGAITSQLQDDAARIQTFSQEPIRSFLIAISSVVTGVVLSFVYMWQFALLAIGCIPLMGFATSMEMKQMLGEDVTDEEGLNSPGGIIVETLLNMNTVSALTMEGARMENFETALYTSEPNYVRDGIMEGATAGLSMFIQQWINGLQLWFGGYLLFTVDGYELNDFLIANFAILFSLFGLGAAFQDMSDRKETERSAGRILHLLDRQSLIDPLSTEGKTL